MKESTIKPKLDFFRKFQNNYQHPALSILDEKLVDSYTETFNEKHNVMWFGANRCPKLGKDLSYFYKEGFASRSRISVGMLTAGFPKWVYCYDFNKKIGEMAYGFTP